MSLVVTVAGTDRSTYVKRGTFRLTQRVNNRDQLALTFRDKLSTSGAYRPQERQIVRVTYYGARIFEGEIISVSDSPIIEPDRGTLTEVEAVSYTELADRLQVTASYLRGTALTTIAGDLVTAKLGPSYGVTSGFTPGTGPLLGFDADFRYKYCSEVLDQLCAFALAGGNYYLWRIDPLKALQFFTIGSSPGPIALTSSNGTAKRMRWSRRTRVFYNAVTALGGGDALLDQNERVAGNGVTRNFPVTGTPVAQPTTCSVSLSGGAPFTAAVGTYTGTGDQPYAWDTVNKRIVQRSDQTLISASGYVDIPYQEQGPIALYRTDTDLGGTSIATYGLREAPPIEAPEITDRFQLRALADAFLRQSADTPQKIEITTRERGWVPGMTQTASFANRGINGQFFIEELEVVDQPVLSTNVTNFLTWKLRGIVGSNIYSGSWIDYFREQRGGSGAGGGSIATGGGGAGGTTTSATIVGASILMMNMGGSRNEAVSDAALTRYAIPNQCPIGIAGTRVNGSILLRGKVRVSNTATRCRLVLRNETLGTDVALTPFSATGTLLEQYLSVTVPRGAGGFEDAEHVYKVELDTDTAGVDNLYWCSYATLENR